MQMHAALDLDHFPDSPYAGELRRNFPDLRFSPELEKEFQVFHLERVRSRVRFFQLAICALAIVAAAHLIFMDGLSVDDVLYGWLGVVVPACLFLVWASWSSYYERIYLPLARVAVPVFAIASAIGDHFKAFNDRYGHQAGDHALRRVAQVVQGFARRPLDIAARYGGEEFVLALFDLSAESVRELTDQLRKSIYALSITHEDSPTAAFVTASVGVAIVGPRIGRSPEGAVQVADEALYSAKRSGRNCVKVVDCDQLQFSTGTFRRSA